MIILTKTEKTEKTILELLSDDFKELDKQKVISDYKPFRFKQNVEVNGFIKEIHLNQYKINNPDSKSNIYDSIDIDGITNLSKSMQKMKIGTKSKNMETQITKLALQEKEQIAIKQISNEKSTYVSYVVRVKRKGKWFTSNTWLDSEYESTMKDIVENPIVENPTE